MAFETIHEMSCQELVELVTEYLEGTLPPSDRARFDQHLADCRHCRLYLEQMRQTIGTLGRLNEDDLSPVVRETLLQAFRNWTPK